MYFRRYHPGFEFNIGFGLFGREYCLSLNSEDEFYSLYTYKPGKEDPSEWEDFYGLTHDKEHFLYLQR